MRFVPQAVLTLLTIPFALAIAGCGGGEDSTETDAAFAAQMLPHHEHAVEMASLALENSSDPDVTGLAEAIIDAQEAEIAELEGLLERFGGSVDDPAPEVMTLNEGVVAELEAAIGPEFDEVFLKEMSAHHSSAIDMAGIEIAGGSDGEAVELAESITSTQLEEIGTMQDLLGTAPATGAHGGGHE